MIRRYHVHDIIPKYYCSEILSALPSYIIKTCQAWDPSGSKPTPSSKSHRRWDIGFYIRVGIGWGGKERRKVKKVKISK